jgi:alkylation response protein AidB-like acyl-CoA dehydrogenase
MVNLMHLVATQTLLAGTREDGPLADSLHAIGAGSLLATLAYSERGSRSHFWAQVSRAERTAGGVRFDADKSWVTAAGHAEAYVTAVGAPGTDDPVVSEIYLLDAGAPGVETAGRFDGLGLRGNASAPVRMRGVEVDDARRLGEPGSGFGLMMTATLPWFALGSAACSLGLAGEALRLACEHAGGARLEHLGSSLADLPTVRARLAEAQLRLMQARALLDEVAGQVEAGAPEAQLGVLAVKAAAGEAAIVVTDEAMRVCGGAGFSRQLPVERYFRDARASAVMAPTADVLRDFIGKAICGLELF